MARLPRVTSKVFAENATEVGQFGSLNAGTKVTTTDIATIQGLPAWEDGWKAANLGDNCYPTLQERNGLDKVQSYMINYLYQEGIPEWDVGTTYYTGSIVKLINGTDVQFYKSLIDNNTNALSDTASWEEILVSGANKDLSNLSATGKTAVVTIAYELDWANQIQVSTTNLNGNQSYTPTKDGILSVVSYSASSSSTASTIYAVIYRNDNSGYYIAGDYIDIPPANGGKHLHCSSYATVLAGETIYFRIYASGNSATAVEAIFVPFKKS